jgi:hypothetical protein
VGIVNSPTHHVFILGLEVCFWVPQMPYATVAQLVSKPNFFTLCVPTRLCMLNRFVARIYDHGFYLLLRYGIHSHVLSVVLFPQCPTPHRSLWERWLHTCLFQGDTSKWLRDLSTQLFLLLWDGIIGKYTSSYLPILCMLSPINHSTLGIIGPLFSQQN